jgi:hypothetical protein
MCFWFGDTRSNGAKGTLKPQTNQSETLAEDFSTVNLTGVVFPDQTNHQSHSDFSLPILKRWTHSGHL